MISAAAAAPLHHFLHQSGCLGNPVGDSLPSGRRGRKLFRLSLCCFTFSSSQESIEKPVKKQDRSTSSLQRASEAGVLIQNSSIANQDGTAPLVSALKACAEQDIACFHFPGHNRGKASPSSFSGLIGVGPFLHDLPELTELDDLFSPKGVILDAQKKASELFGSSETRFLVGGTTCGVQASIMATCSPGDTLILPRNSHISATSGMVLSGAVPKYIIPEYDPQWDIAGGISSAQVERVMRDLEREGKRAAAVLVTSPTYHGLCSNLSDITKLCHSRGIPVIVDEAHGAHFRFHLQFPNTALEQDADLAVQSTHKVLCSLTQSSMLHVSGNLVDRDCISRCLQTLQSSSPSYLLLASLDAARAQLSDRRYVNFDDTVELAIKARNQIQRIRGVSVLSLPGRFSSCPTIDPLRVTVGVWQLGLSGYEADEILTKEQHVISELSGSRSLTFAINLGTRREDIQRLVLGINHLSGSIQDNRLHHRVQDCRSAPFADIDMSLSPRQAFFAKKMKVDIGQSIGEICGELICPYPPGIPVLFPGEIITEQAMSYLLDVRNEGALISGAADHQLSSIVVCKL